MDPNAFKNGTFSFDNEAAMTVVRCSSQAIDDIACDGTSTIIRAGKEYWRLGAHNPGNPRPARKADLVAMLKGKPPTDYACLCETALHGQRRRAEVGIKLIAKTDGSTKLWYTVVVDWAQAAAPKACYCLHGNDVLLWGTPSEIHYAYLNAISKRGPSDMIPVHPHVPTCIAYDPGLVIFGTLSGEVVFLDFWPNSASFILALAEDDRPKRRKRAER